MCIRRRECWLVRWRRGRLVILWRRWRWWKVGRRLRNLEVVK